MTCMTIMQPGGAGIKTLIRSKLQSSLFNIHVAVMSASEMPSPPPRNSSAKKRKFDELEQLPPPLPPTDSFLYIVLYALPPPKRRGGVLNYRWAFLVAPDDTPRTRGRQYLIRETALKVDPFGGAGSSKGLALLGLEQQRRPFDRLLVTNPFEDRNDAQKLSGWEFETQDVCMQSSRDAQVRIQLPRVQDVESFEALIKDAFFISDGRRGVDWNPVMWMGDAWTALIEAGDVLGVGGMESELLDWGRVQETAMEFFEAQGNKGRYVERSLTLRVPTWGLLERRLLIS